MAKILIWGLGVKYNLYINAIKYCELMGEIEIVGVTDKKELYTCLDGYPFIPWRRFTCMILTMLRLHRRLILKK